MSRWRMFDLISFVSTLPLQSLGMPGRSMRITRGVA